jgi:hypothetical protein
MERHGLSPPSTTVLLGSTGGLSPMAFLVGVKGDKRERETRSLIGHPLQPRQIT